MLQGKLTALSRPIDGFGSVLAGRGGKGQERGGKGQEIREGVGE